MDAVFNFIMDRMFAIDLLLVGLIFAFKFPHRKMFVLRLVISVALCLVAGRYGSRFLHNILPDALNNMGLGYIYEFALVLLVFTVCYKMSLGSLIYVGASAYFIQHSIYCVKSLFSDSFYEGWLDIFLHFGFLMIVIAAVYALFYRKVDSENLKTIKFKHVIVCVGIILILCVILNSTAGNDQQAKRSFLFADLLCNVVGLIFQYSILVISINNNENIRIKELLDKNAPNSLNFPRKI